jgi:hypothetical protein
LPQGKICKTSLGFLKINSDPLLHSSYKEKYIQNRKMFKLIGLAEEEVKYKTEPE